MPSNPTTKSNQTFVDLFSHTEVDMSELESIFQNDEESEELRHEFDANENSDGRSSSMATVGTDGRCSSVDLENPQCSRSRNKRRPPSADPSELLYELISTRKRNPVDFLPPSVPKDHLDHFFESLASTMRTFPALSVATLKLKMSQLVGEEEVSLAQQPQTAQIVYIQQPNEVFTNLIAENDSNETEQNNMPIVVSDSNVSPSERTTKNNDVLE